jgi:nucleoside-diphosphate-sugar epimerase
MENLSVFGGTGFVGGKYMSMYPTATLEPRDNNFPRHENILYFISTTHNYNVFDNITLDVETNLIKLLKVLDNCKNSNIVFNFISSWFVYGDCPLPAKEDYYCNPKGFYSITKKCAEDLIISFCKTYNVKYRILRLSNIVGKGDASASPKKNALQFIINNLKNNEDVFLYHYGNFSRDYLHVKDACEYIEECITFGPINCIINIGSGNAYNFKDIVDIACLLTGSKSNIYSRSPSPFHDIVQVKDMSLDIKKLKSFSKKTTIISIEDIVKEMI